MQLENNLILFFFCPFKLTQRPTSSSLCEICKGEGEALGKGGEDWAPFFTTRKRITRFRKVRMDNSNAFQMKPSYSLQDPRKTHYWTLEDAAYIIHFPVHMIVLKLAWDRVEKSKNLSISPAVSDVQTFWELSELPIFLLSVQFSCSVVSNSLQSHVP